MEIKSLPVQNEDGDLVPGSSATVYHMDSGDVATIYDRGGQIISNPITAGADGIIEFAAENGPYRVMLTIGIQQYERFLYFSDIQEHNHSPSAHPELSAFITSEADRAEQAADSAALNAGIYADTTAGLSATTEGDYFSVPSAEDDEYLILYLHEAGPVATEIKRYPSSEAIDAVSEELNAVIGTMYVDESKVPLARTSNGKIPLWLENGLIGAVGVTEQIGQSVEEQMAERGAVMREAPDNYPPFMVKTSNGKVVFVVDYDGEAYYYGNVVGSASVDVGGIPGASLFRYKSKLGKLINGTSAIAKVALTGDSWRERNIIPQAIADRLYAAYGQGADGWIGLNTTSAIGPLNGGSLSKTGWTLSDISSSISGLYAPDGHRLDCSDDTGTLTCTGINAETIKIYYLDTDGAFRYQVDGGGFVTVTGTNTGDAAHVEISGLSTSGTHTINIDTTVNAGTVSLFGIYATGIDGVEVSKIANGGSRAVSYDAIYAQESVAYILDDIEYDAVEICLGSNDYRLGDSPEGYHDGLANLASAYRDAVSDCGVIITSPAANGRPEAGYPMQDYRDQAVLAASQNGYEHFDQFSLFGTYVEMNALGAWADDLHLNALGATLTAEEINRIFLQPFNGVS